MGTWDAKLRQGLLILEGRHPVATGYGRDTACRGDAESLIGAGEDLPVGSLTVVYYLQQALLQVEPCAAIGVAKPARRQVLLVLFSSFER